MAKNEKSKTTSTATKKETSAETKKSALELALSKIEKDLGKILKPGGWFFMEIGADQAEDVAAIFKDSTSYINIVFHNDYAGLPRVFQAQKQ